VNYLLIIILIILLVILFLAFSKRTEDKEIENDDSSDFSYYSNIEEDDDDILIDEYGRKYRLVKKIIKTERRTYVKGLLTGKYRGDYNDNYSSQYTQYDFFNFEIYEALLSEAEYSKDGPFLIEGLEGVKNSDVLLNPIRMQLKDSEELFEVNLREPVFYLPQFDSGLHQEFEKEVFGTIRAGVTGYILDIIEEEVFEREYIQETVKPTASKPRTELYKTDVPTGKEEKDGDYIRKEFYYSNYKDTYWGNWERTRSSTAPVESDGCISSLLSLLLLIFGIAALLFFLPYLAVFLPIIGILGLFYLLSLIPRGILKWLGSLILGLLLIAFLFFVFQHLSNSKETVRVNENENVNHPIDEGADNTPIEDSADNSNEEPNENSNEGSNNNQIQDELIKHNLTWTDYNGNTYGGEFWTSRNKFKQSKRYKSNLNLEIYTPGDYDYMVYLLKENDKNSMNGVYQLFDELGRQNNLNRVQFAEMIVSFVQSIPYTVILPEACIPELYDDDFVKQYLAQSNAKCVGNEKFGINSPVEFMSNLKGDCDTRTLFLYTVFLHYNYDVALFSSEYYNHSLIGLDIPLEGLTYKYDNHNYVLWETTATGLKPGEIPFSLSDLRHWRISLKSQ